MYLQKALKVYDRLKCLKKVSGPSDLIFLRSKTLIIETALEAFSLMGVEYHGRGHASHLSGIILELKEEKGVEIVCALHIPSMNLDILSV